MPTKTSNLIPIRPYNPSIISIREYPQYPLDLRSELRPYNHQLARTMKDEDTGRIINLAVWDSREQWEAALPLLHEEVKDDPFEDWEHKPPEVFHPDPK